jgi:hypothetical protein
MLMGCNPASAPVLHGEDAPPPPSIVQNRIPSAAPGRPSAKDIISASRANPSAKELIPPGYEPTEFEKNVQDGFLAISILRVASTPFMLPF